MMGVTPGQKLAKPAQASPTRSFPSALVSGRGPDIGYTISLRPEAEPLLTRRSLQQDQGENSVWVELLRFGE